MIKIDLNKNLYLTFVGILLIGIIGRLIPHPANMTPLLGVSLLAGSTLPRKYALSTILLILLLSDVLLSIINHYALFGSWSFFTYSGYLLITAIGLKIQKINLNNLKLVLALSLFYWLWTNFGVWLLSDLYIKSVAGFVACYTAALPFLRNALVGDLLWYLLIFNGFFPAREKSCLTSKQFN